ncbi:hypothetical protein ACQEVS_30540 [Streptomyces sp. CA-181903]|uniref:hypothetical protein n=1 Tax=Streptomyces sp. CA-181903 TaxID=3240055 RepID=UPI003D918F12
MDEETRQLVFQGREADEKTRDECLKSGPIPDYEAVIRVPFSMVAAIREACDVAERAAVR